MAVTDKLVTVGQIKGLYTAIQSDIDTVRNSVPDVSSQITAQVATMEEFLSVINNNEQESPSGSNDEPNNEEPNGETNGESGGENNEEENDGE